MKDWTDALPIMRPSSPKARRWLRLLASVLLVAPAALLAVPSASAAPASVLTRYPYLTDATQSSMTVNFATTRASTVASVRWGPQGDCSANTTSATSTSISVNGVAQYQWKADLPVSPDTSYCYRPFLGTTDLLGSDPTPTFTSQVARGSTSPFSFAVFGDWGQAYAGSANVDQQNVLSQIARSGARFAVMTGDTAYPNGDQKNYGDLQQTGTDISSVFAPQFWGVPGRSIPVYNVTGNHGFTNGAHQVVNWPEHNVARESGGRYLMEPYPSINGSTARSYPSMWYAFDAGNARFYVLTSAWADGNVGSASGPYEQDYEAHMKPGTPQYEWLKADLAAHPGGVKMAFWHYPLYADSSGQPSDTWLQGGEGTLQGLLNSNNVAVAFNGHAHGYERNVPDSAGMVSYVVGNGGAALGRVSGCSAFDAYAIGSSGSHCGAAPATTPNAEVFGFVKVTVDGQRITVTPTSSTGRTYDQQTYTVPSSEPDAVAPSVPTNVAAANQSVGSTKVTWTASTDNVGVTGYKIYRDPGPAGSPAGDTLVGTVDGSTTSFTDSTVAPGTSYTYKVSAIDAAGNSSNLSAPATVTATGSDTTAPTTPGSFNATATSSSTVSLTWTASSDSVGVTGYRISRNGSVLTEVSGTTTSYLDESASPNTSYTYEIRAVDASGNQSQPASSTVTTPGSGTGQVSSLTFTPTDDTWVDQANPTATHGTDTRLVADNSPVNDALMKFDVQGTGSGTSCPTVTGARLTLKVGSGGTDNSGRGGDFYGASSNWSEVTSGTVNAVSWNTAPAASGAPVASITTSVAVNTAYTVDVSSLVTGNGAVSIRLKNPSSNGVRYFSKEGSTTDAPRLEVQCSGASGGGGGGTADTQAPTAPSGLAAGTPTSSTVPLSWGASSDNVGVTSYEVFRDGATTPIGASTGTSFTDTGLSPGTTHTYTVKAVDAAGNRSAASNSVSATTASSGGGGGSTTLTFAPTDDAWVDQANPTATHGTESRLVADSSPVNDLLMQFDVQGTGAGTSCPTVTGATLTMTVGSGGTDNSGQGGYFYGTASTPTKWDENTLSWSTAPAVSGPAVASITTSVAVNTAYTVNVSPLVTGNAPVSIRVRNTSSNGVRYFSKEGSTAGAPKLVLSCGP